MKVEQKKEFSPIVITLETYEEARQMWHHLNTFSEYVEETARENDDLSFLAISDLFNKFNKSFTPNEVE